MKHNKRHTKITQQRKKNAKKVKKKKFKKGAPYRVKICTKRQICSFRCLDTDSTCPSGSSVDHHRQNRHHPIEDRAAVQTSPNLLLRLPRVDLALIFLHRVKSGKRRRICTSLALETGSRCWFDSSEKLMHSTPQISVAECNAAINCKRVQLCSSNASLTSSLSENTKNRANQWNHAKESATNHVVTTP